jgi:hypothetical protein
MTRFLFPADEFSMPQGPGAEPASQRMTNEDFRKLMMTPRAGSSGASAATPSLGGASADGSQTPTSGGKDKVGLVGPCEVEYP